MYKHIRGKDNIVADALSRIDLSDLKGLNPDYNSIFAITRSMTRDNSNNTEEIKVTPNLPKPMVFEENFEKYNKKTPRIKTCNFEIKQNELKSLILKIQKNYGTILNFTIHGIANEKLTITSILSKLEKRATACNIASVIVATDRQILFSCEN